MRTTLIALASMFLACSDGGSTGTTSGAATNGSSSGGGGSAATLDASKIFRGTLTLSGTITLPAGTGAGKSIQLTASGGGEDITTNGSQVGPAGTTPGDTVPYTVTGLGEGEYSIRARIDVDGNGSLGAEDLDGYSGGTLEAPITDFSKAKKVVVGPGGATGVDFGVGKPGGS